MVAFIVVVGALLTIGTIMKRIVGKAHVWAKYNGEIKAWNWMITKVRLAYTEHVNLYPDIDLPDVIWIPDPSGKHIVLYDDNTELAGQLKLCIGWTIRFAGNVFDINSSIYDYILGRKIIGSEYMYFYDSENDTVKPGTDFDPERNFDWTDLYFTLGLFVALRRLNQVLPSAILKTLMVLILRKIFGTDKFKELSKQMDELSEAEIELLELIDNNQIADAAIDADILRKVCGGRII